MDNIENFLIAALCAVVFAFGFVIGIYVGEGGVYQKAVRDGAATWGHNERGEPVIKWIIKSSEKEASEKQER